VLTLGLAFSAKESEPHSYSAHRVAHAEFNLVESLEPLTGFVQGLALTVRYLMELLHKKLAPPNR
jgi:hypothetical protein